MIDLRLGDMLQVLPTLDADSIDAVVTDPPYDLTSGGSGGGFMNKSWDATGVAFKVETWQAVKRVMKPGAQLLAFGGDRTIHRMITAIEDAGFVICGQIGWLNGAGFPKAHLWDTPTAEDWKHNPTLAEEDQRMVDAGFEGWARGGLKPAMELIVRAQKPLERGLTIAGNVARWGTGGLNIDASRIGTTDDRSRPRGTFPHSDDAWGNGHLTHTESHPTGRWPSNVLLSHISPGPDGSGGCVEVGTKRVKSNGAHPKVRNDTPNIAMSGRNYARELPARIEMADADGCEVVSAWECVDHCPIRILDEQAGERKSGGPNGRPRRVETNLYGGGRGLAMATDTAHHYGDTGGASRFFKTFPPEVEPAIDVPFVYLPKASRRERNAGCEGLPEQGRTFGQKRCTTCGRQKVNVSGTCQCPDPVWIDVADHAPRTNGHPTVKSLALMDYLIKMICPPGGTVLDCFMGSGSTGCSAVRLGFDFIGIEMEPDYMSIAQARIAYWSNPQPQAKPTGKGRAKDYLFGRKVNICMACERRGKAGDTSCPRCGGVMEWQTVEGRGEEKEPSAAAATFRQREVFE